MQCKISSGIFRSLYLYYVSVTNLLKQSAFYAVTDESATAELLACNTKHRVAKEEQLHAGAEATIVNVFGNTCLHQILHSEYLATEYDHETLQMLLDHDVPMKARTKNLHIVLACNQGNINFMCVLVNAAADPHSASICCSNFHRIGSGCSSNLTLQTIMQSTLIHTEPLATQNPMYLLRLVT